MRELLKVTNDLLYDQMERLDALKNQECSVDVDGHGYETERVEKRIKGLLEVRNLLEDLVGR